MNKSEVAKSNFLSIDLSDRNDDNIISNSIKESSGTGNAQVDLEVKTSPENEVIRLRLDINMFRRIKEVQDLPDWVIIKLILADGKLKNSRFKERISNG